jgi:hypothetical protein
MTAISKIDKNFLLKEQRSTNPVDLALTPVSKTNEIIDEVNDLEDRLSDLEDGSISTTDLDISGALTTDTINEHTSATGVTVDGVLLKDASIALNDGLVSNLAIKIGADQNNGLYGISDTQLGIAVEGVLVGGANTTGLFTGNIAEQVTNAGVTVDSVLLKDGGVSNSAGTIFAGYYPLAVQDNITAGTGGAIVVTNYLTTINTDAGGDAFTLADGTQIGQLKKILLVADGGGDGVITPAHLTGGTTITMDDAADYVILIWSGTSWSALENSGCIIA